MPTNTAVELLINGQWVNTVDDPAAYPLGRDRVTITRGKQNNASTTDPSTCSLSLRDLGGKWSPRNPMSPYYGLIGRNTPLRVRTPGVGDGTYLVVPGELSTPDTAVLDITGDIDIRAELTLDDWTVAGSIALKYTAGGNQRSWAMWINSLGRPHLRWTTDGTGGTIHDVAAAATPIVAAGGRLAVRATLDVDNGAAGHTVTFYTSPTIDGTWTQLGGPIATAGVTSIFSSTAPLIVGNNGQITLPNPVGRVHAFELRSGIGGTVVADPVASEQDSGVTSFTDSTGRVWTVGAGAYLTNPDVRFVGEVSAWPPRWDPSGADVWVPIEAAGILRRLSQGAKPLKSPVLREATAADNLTKVVGYWPCEDGRDSIRLASGVGGTPMRIVGDLNLAASEDVFRGAQALPILGATGIGPGRCRPYANTGTIAFRGLFSFPAAGLANGTRLMELWQTGSSTVRRWRLVYETGGAINLQAFDSSGAFIEGTGGAAFAVNGTRLMFGWQVEQNGGDVDWGMFTRRIEADGTVGAEVGSNGTYATPMTVGQATDLYVAPDRNMADCVVGHFMVGSDISLAAGIDQAIVGYHGESAVDRMRRLCTEEGVLLAGYPDSYESTSCGPQRTATLLDLLGDAAAADGGILCDARDVLGLTYRPRASLYNQTGALPLNYEAGDVAPPLEPVDDDRLVRNKVTVTRLNGSSAVAELEEGPLSTQAPPAGVGLYDDAPTLNVASDDQLPDIASWRKHLGTWDEARFPSVSVDLHTLTADGKTGLVAAAAAVDVGDRVTIDNPPPWLPPDPIDVIVEGVVEELDALEWKRRFVCVPAGSYRVFQLDDDVLGRLESSGTERQTTPIGTTQTSINFTITDGPFWSTADVPFDIIVGGERMTVTAIAAPSGANQVFTVVRTLVKSHPVGTKVYTAGVGVLAL